MKELFNDKAETREELVASRTPQFIDAEIRLALNDLAATTRRPPERHRADTKGEEFYGEPTQADRDALRAYNETLKRIEAA